MDVKIDYTQSAQENANTYYQKAKRLILKKQGAEKAIADLRKTLARESAKKDKPAKKLIEKQKREWYEKFHWFFTSTGHLVIGGRDASQNELLNSKHFEEGDLFLHANIFGGSVTILKEGTSAPQEAHEEAAQFAGCNSSAWKEGLGTIDVYAMKRDQVSKSTSKGSLGSGSFLLSGEREWHRNVKLGLAMFIKEGKLQTVPISAFEKISEKPTKNVILSIGKDKKSDAAKKIGKILGYDDLDYIMQQLPTGSFSVRL